MNNVQITLRNLDPSDGLTRHVEKRVEKLSTFFDRIISCRVAIEAPPRDGHGTSPYRVRIDIGVPGGEIVATNPVAHPSSTDAHAAIDVAFELAKRRLKEYAHRQRGDVKTHVQRAPVGA